jgi:hypothetical protein
MTEHKASAITLSGLNDTDFNARGYKTKRRLYIQVPHCFRVGCFVFKTISPCLKGFLCHARIL